MRSHELAEKLIDLVQKHDHVSIEDYNGNLLFRVGNPAARLALMLPEDERKFWPAKFCTATETLHRRLIDNPENP